MKANSRGSTSLLEEWIDHKDESFHFLSPQEALEIRNALLTWYRGHRRKLPWRGDPSPWDGSAAATAMAQRTQNASTSKGGKQRKLDHFFASNQNTTANGKTRKDASSIRKEDSETVECFPVSAYGVWVSEIMLQQTRVEAVIPYWVKWMKSFPTVHDLANASEEEVNAHWAGLGFYRRARLLHQAAKYVSSELDGDLPKTVDGLLELSGVGRYTACAIASIAYNVKVPVVDGNVCRVLSRLMAIAQHVKAPVLKDKWGWDLASQIVEAGDGSCPGELNQALMELGATYCSPSGTGVDDDDPLKNFYRSTRIGVEFIHAQRNKQLQSKIEALIDGDTRADDGSTAIKKGCQICGSAGVSQVLGTLSEDISVQLQVTTEPKDVMARKCGHSVFPTAPPKSQKKEEAYAIAAVSSTCNNGIHRWLLVKRPSQGLLAGQWEFPAALVWTSDENSKTKSKKRKSSVDAIEVPVIAPITRERALNKLLQDLGLPEDETVSKRSKLDDVPLEHIFSHVRHTMWIEHTHLEIEANSTLDWLGHNERRVKWMEESEMEKVGVTSGFRKILKAVKAHKKCS